MRNTLKVFLWVLAGASAISAVGFVMMALDGYDYSSPGFPQQGSLADSGLIVAGLGDIIRFPLLLATWILLAIWTLKMRSIIPASWKEGKAGVWLWWIVPVAAFWKPRDVYLELARASRPGELRATTLVNRWWLWLITYFVAANLYLIVDGSPSYHAAFSVLAAAAAAPAALFGNRMIEMIGTPELSYLSAPQVLDDLDPIAAPHPTVPGWYYDPSGQAGHQAYWDGGRWTGATRPDPRIFPTVPEAQRSEPDTFRNVLIAAGIIYVVAVVLYFLLFTPIDEPISAAQLLNWL